jgi:hypothetical protein
MLSICRTKLRKAAIPSSTVVVERGDITRFDLVMRCNFPGIFESLIRDHGFEITGW